MKIFVLGIFDSLFLDPRLLVNDIDDDGND